MGVFLTCAHFGGTCCGTCHGDFTGDEPYLVRPLYRLKDPDERVWSEHPKIDGAVCCNHERPTRDELAAAIRRARR